MTARMPVSCRKLPSDPIELTTGQRPGPLAKQAAAHRERGQPDQAGKAQTAEHRGRAEIFDTPDFAVLLACHVIGEFFESSVEEFYRKYDEQCPYHGHVPGAARGNRDAKHQPCEHEKRFIAERRLRLEAVNQSPKRILGGAVKTFQDRSED